MTMADRIRGAALGDAISGIVRQVVEKHPATAARTLARRVVAETGGAITLEQARARVRICLGVKGKAARSSSTTKHLHRPPRDAGQRLELPPSQADPWLPFDLGITGKIGVLSDIHIPYHDETALRAAVAHLQGEKIDALLLNGDWADFYSISRHEKNPKHRNFKRELEAGRLFLKWVRQEFPDVRIVAKSGNHEERFEKWLFEHAPEISDDPIMGLDNWYGMPALGIELVKDKRIITAGELPILHGHEKGNGISSPVNQARGAFLRLHHTVLEGHGHRTSTHSEPDMFGRETVCFSTGCLCDLRPAYAVLNKWNHGFACVEVHAGGEFDVANLRVQSGKVRQS
jgi:predicted phosphodiesterase